MKASIEKEKLKTIGFGSVCLTEESIYHFYNNQHISILLINISSVTIESNFKLQIYDKAFNQMFQFDFFNESALKWQDYIIETIKSNYSFLPNTR